MATIFVEKQTRTKLKSAGRKEQTYDEIINELLEKKSSVNFPELTDQRVNMSKQVNTTGNSNADLNYGDVCSAFDCLNKATEKMTVEAGKFGTISLNLCKDCVKIFEVVKNE